MSHQPFENWLFDETPLTPQENMALQDHLRSCEPCRLLSVAWREVEHQLQVTPYAAPQPGFTSRWQARLEADHQRLLRRQSLAVLGFSVTGAVLLLASLGILLLPWLRDPGVLLWTWLYRVISLISVATAVQDTLASVFRSATGAVPLGWWVLFVGLLSELAVLWVVSYRILSNPRRIVQ